MIKNFSLALHLILSLLIELKNELMIRLLESFISFSLKINSNFQVIQIINIIIELIFFLLS